MKKYLKYLIVMAVFLAAGCAFNAATADKNFAAADEVTHLRQMITADSSTSRTIMWQADEALKEPLAEYRTDGGEIKTAAAEAADFTVDGRNVYVYTAKLTRLEPGTSYQYRAGYEGCRTDWQTLQTASGGDFKALIFPDSQSSDYSGWHKLADTAYANNKDAAFFINMGDLVDNGYDLSQWNAWFNSVEPMIANIPFAPVMGNHETYTLDWQVGYPTPYLTLFNLPANGSENTNQYYSFDYNDVHFAVLNTQTDEMAEFNPNLMAQQLEWLRSDLANTTAKWKVVLMHKDVLRYAFTDRPNSFDPATVQFTPWAQQLMPVFDEFNVDAVLTAHLHTYRRRVPMKNFAADSSGTTYILTGVAGSVRYANLWQRNPADAALAPQPEDANYLTLEKTDGTLTFKAYLPDGTEFDSVTITKERS